MCVMEKREGYFVRTQSKQLLLSCFCIVLFMCNYSAFEIHKLNLSDCASTAGQGGIYNRIGHLGFIDRKDTMFILYCISAAVLVLYICYKYLWGNTNYWPSRGIPVLKNKDVSTFLQRINTPHQEYDKLIYDKLKELKLPFVGLEEFGRPIIFVTDLELAKHILVKDFDHFTDRGSFDSQHNQKYFGDMMIVKNGKEWKESRALQSPIFTSLQIRKAFNIFTLCSDKMIKQISESVDQFGNEVNLETYFGKLATDVISRAAFGIDCQIFENEKSLFAIMKNIFHKDFTGPLGLVMIILFPKIAKFFNVSLGNKKATQYFANFIAKIMENRKVTQEEREDFLQTFLNTQIKQKKVIASEKSENVISDDFIIAQCLMMFAGGMESIESILSFLAYELALNQDVQEKLFTEIITTMKESNGDLSTDIISGMEYLDQVVSENLRLHTIGTRSERKVTQNYKVPDSDVVILKNEIIDIPIWAIHHDENYFPNARKFDPERFSKANKSKILPYTYMPFGLGPRHCIGMRFALMEKKMAIVKLVYNFKLEVCRKTPVPMIFKRTASMKPADGIWLKLTPRANKSD